MLADLHCHYPMHVVAGDPGRSPPGTPKLTVEAMTSVSKRPGWLEKLRAAALRIAATASSTATIAGGSGSTS